MHLVTFISYPSVKTQHYPAHVELQFVNALIIEKPYPAGITTTLAPFFKSANTIPIVIKINIIICFIIFQKFKRLNI